MCSFVHSKQAFQSQCFSKSMIWKFLVRRKKSNKKLVHVSISLLLLSNKWDFSSKHFSLPRFLDQNLETFPPKIQIENSPRRVSLGSQSMMKFGLELLKMVAKMQGGATDDTYFAKNYIFKELSLNINYFEAFTIRIKYSSPNWISISVQRHFYSPYSVPGQVSAHNKLIPPKLELVTISCLESGI